MKIEGLGAIWSRDFNAKLLGIMEQKGAT